MSSAIQLLLAEHKELKRLLVKVYKSSEKSAQIRKNTFQIIKFKADLHEKMEEKFLYSRLKDFKLSRPNAFEHHEEVALVKHLIPQLSRLAVTSEQWTAKFKVFKELNDHHIEEEEDEKFPQAVKLLSRGELKAIGEKMLAFKQKHNMK